MQHQQEKKKLDKRLEHGLPVDEPAASSHSVGASASASVCEREEPEEEKTEVESSKTASPQDSLFLWGLDYFTLYVRVILFALVLPVKVSIKHNTHMV